MVCPDGLDGRTGGNRTHPGENNMGVDTDLAAVHAWLHEKQQKHGSSPTHPTYLNYRKEAERLLLWAWFEAGKALSDLSRSDLSVYFDFLSHPPADWLSHGNYTRSNPDWRPLIEPLSQDSRRQASGILRSMFAFLAAQGYLSRNPLEMKLNLGLQNSGDEPSGAERHLPQGAWDLAVARLDHAERHTQDDMDKAHLARERWIVMLLVNTGLRRHEAAKALMRDIKRRDLGADGGETWWLHVVGKGQKQRDIPLPRVLMSELARYRRSLGLTERPAPGEKRPLVVRLARSGLPVLDSERTLSGTILYYNVIRFFGRAAEYASRESSSASDREYLADLQKASPHWLRHTYLTRIVARNVPLQHAQANAGHARIDTTGQYLHTDMIDRARTIERLNGDS